MNRTRARNSRNPKSKRLRPNVVARSGTSRWVITGLLVIGLVIMAGPFVWMVLSSFKTQAEITSVVPTLFPENPTLDDYRQLFEQLDFVQYFWNSTLIAGVVTIANILFTGSAGYALAKIPFAGRRVVFGIVLATLMVPSSVTLVPLLTPMSKLGLLNTYTGVILPLAAGPFGVFLMRQFMGQIPDELIEAAKIDGASHLRIFFQIALPLSAARRGARHLHVPRNLECLPCGR